MPERMSIHQVSQIGVESTPGTPVATNRRLLATSITPGPEMEFSPFRPSGYLWPTVVPLNTEWSEADIEGRGSFTDMVYLLSSLVTTGVITTPTNAINARQWEFWPASSGSASPKTFTLDNGDASIAERVAGLIVNELSIDFSRTGDVEIGGSAFGRAMLTGQTLGVAPTEIVPVPMMPGNWSVYLDAPGGAPGTALGTTKLSRPSSGSISIGDRWARFWALDAAQPSYVATGEAEPSGTVELSLMADATGMGLITNARAGDTRMLRLENIGAQIDSGVVNSAYRFTFDAAVKIVEVGDKEDEDGFSVIPYTFQIVHDAVWGGAYRFRVVNALTAL